MGMPLIAIISGMVRVQMTTKTTVVIYLTSRPSSPDGLRAVCITIKTYNKIKYITIRQYYRINHKIQTETEIFTGIQSIFLSLHIRPWFSIVIPPSILYYSSM